MNRTESEADDGFTLIELLVAMALFSILLAIFASATTIMLKDVRRQDRLSDDADGARRVVQQLDKQIRYANAVNTPGATADGTVWVEWQQGNKGQQQTCVQWRLRPDGNMQYRTWQPILSGSGTVTPTGWVSRANHISPPASGAVFSLAPTVAASNASKQQLTIKFRAIQGSPAVSKATQVTLTALNTKTSNTPATAVCQEVSRT
jgi:prepilin-type N-terminal cleavage/methylation domain-containing protein